MSFSFSQTSKDKLKGVHPNLTRVVEKALSYGIMDFAVVQGVRTKEQQEMLFKQGRDPAYPGPIVTWTKKSKHLKQADDYGHAVDLVPIINGRMDWQNLDNFTVLASLMYRAAMEEGVKILWGGFWIKTKDRPHFELIGENNG